MMSNRSRDDFDRLMTGWMEADARVREPEDLLDRVLDGSRAARRRPRWLVPDWWFSMQNVARLQAVWRPAPLLIVIAALIVALALIAALLGGSQRRLPAPFGPARNGSIVYDTNGTIEIADQTGSGARTLVGSVPNAAAPLFSPDGLHFAFWGDNSPDTLHVADSDGLNVRRLAGNLWISTDKSPAWSPDSGRLVFSTESRPDALDEHLIVVDVRTQETVTIDAAVAGARLVLPTWSPDSSWIAFLALDGQSGSIHVWVARPDGTDARELATTELQATGVGPRWAPSGSKHVIAYNSLTSDHRTIATTFDLDTGRETKLPGDGSEPAFWPAWAPDGTRLAWLDGPNAGSLHVVPVDGSASSKRLGAGLGRPVAWSPDGTRIYGLTSSRAGLVIVTIDGSVAPVRLPHRASQGLPDWQRLAP